MTKANEKAEVVDHPAQKAADRLGGGLALLRAEFPENQISKLPKPTRAQTDAVKADFKKGVRCLECGAWHHPEVVHLDYVGHAALTDRLLDADPMWTWEPVAFTAEGLPAFDATGGLWIRLTVCGVTRLGYGNAARKNEQDPGAREKEVIGDALRNAAMRFGAALDLWHKGDLHAHHVDADADEQRPATRDERAPAGRISPAQARKNGDWERITRGMALQRTPDELKAYVNHPDQKAIWSKWPDHWKAELREEMQKVGQALMDKLERERSERDLDTRYDPKTGEIREDVPFDDDIPF